MSGLRRLRALSLLLLGLLGLSGVRAMEPLADGELAAVRGRDGLYFNLENFSFTGNVDLVYTSPAGAVLRLGDLAFSRSDDPAHTYDDPYALWVGQRAGGLSDVLHLDMPVNAAGLQRWQAAMGLQVQADGITRDLGDLVVRDLAFYGGGLQLTTPDVSLGHGAAFGLSLRTEIGSIALLPRGRGDSSEAMTLSGIRLGAVDATGQFTGQPWVLADVTDQPGLLQAITDADGPALMLKVDWNQSGSGGPRAGLAIDSIQFTSGGVVQSDLGSSRIASMQLHYLDLRLRPGP